MRPGPVLRFDSFELHPTERRLFVRGRPADVGSRAFDLLLALAEQRGALVSKDQLLDRVWPKLVVSENNLHVHVSALRKLLGMNAISTVPGRGYRLALRQLPESAAAVRRDADPPATRPPPQPVEMHGRAAELALLLQWMGAHRLVSIVGPGGVGKTMLADAAALARARAEATGAGAARVCRVDVHGLTEPAQLSHAVAGALGRTGVNAGGRVDLPTANESSEACVGADPALLVLDGAEHLLDAVARLSEELLQDAPELRLLVTSQSALRLEGERVLRLDPLPIPPIGMAPQIAARYAVVALFASEAQAADQRFALDDAHVDAIVDVCRRLDGLPLAIKLAAQRTHALGLTALRELLPDHLQLLRNAHRGAPPRHRTLIDAFAWSARLLDDTECQVLRRLATLDGVFALDRAMQTAAGGDLGPGAVMEALASLVERSLVQLDAQGPRGYRLLTGIRACALRLEGESIASASSDSPGSPTAFTREDDRAGVGGR